MKHFFASKLLIWRQIWVGGVQYGNSLVVRRVSPDKIIVVLFWTKYAIPRQIIRGILARITLFLNSEKDGPCEGRTHDLSVISIMLCRLRINCTWWIRNQFFLEIPFDQWFKAWNIYNIVPDFKHILTTLLQTLEKQHSLPIFFFFLLIFTIVT